MHCLFTNIWVVGKMSTVKLFFSADTGLNDACIVGHYYKKGTHQAVAVSGPLASP